MHFTLAVWVCGQVCATVAEILVLVTTWQAAYGLKRAACQLRLSLPLVTILLRDGESTVGGQHGL